MNEPHRSDEGLDTGARAGIRVGVLTTSFPLGSDSASGVFVQRMVESLPDGFDVTVLTPCGSTPVREPVGHRYRLQCFRYAPWRFQCLAHAPGGIPAASGEWRNLCWLPFFLLAMVFATLRLARRVDVLHANWSVTGVIAGWAGRLLRVPVLTTLRGSDVHRALNSRLYRRVLGRCLQLSGAVTVVSAAMTERLRAGFRDAAGRVSHIPNGVDGALLELPCAQRVANEPLRLIFIGSLVHGKRLGTLIRALAVLPEGLDVRLTVVGDGPELVSLGALSSQIGVADRIQWIGTVAPGRVIDHLAATHALVLPSMAEGRPNVVIEAMAAARAVLATRIEGIEELLGVDERGLTFAVDDHTELAGLIERLWWQADLVARLGQTARDWIVSEGLTWAATGRRYAALYRTLVAREKG